MSQTTCETVITDVGLTVASVVACIFGTVSLFFGWRCLSWASIIFVDSYLIAVILTAAIRADKKNKTYQSEWKANWLFPSRRVGVITIPLLAFALIIAFAGLYWSTHGERDFKGDFSTYIDSLYFSLVTLTTVGYGDIAPLSEFARKIVMLEISSGFLVLIGAFPLLISRISDYSDD
jgi:voltage-gated potassium channel Kch